MAFEGNFSITQNTEKTITLTDTSTGSDDTITSRTITVKDYKNDTFYTTLWDISDSSKTLENLLPKDEVFNIRVDWNTDTPDPSNTYAKTQLAGFDYYNMIQMGQLISESMARNPSVINDNNFRNYFFNLYFFIVAERVSVGLMNDIMKGQFSADEATKLRLNQTKYY